MKSSENGSCQGKRNLSTWAKIKCQVATEATVTTIARIHKSSALVRSVNGVNNRKVPRKQYRMTLASRLSEFLHKGDSVQHYSQNYEIKRRAYYKYSSATE